MEGTSSINKTLYLTLALGAAAAVGVGLYAGAIFALSRRHQAEHKRSREQRLTPARIKQILLFPCGACRGFSASSWPLNKQSGLVLDREWLVVDEATGQKITGTAKQYAIHCHFETASGTPLIDEATGNCRVAPDKILQEAAFLVVTVQPDQAAAAADKGDATGKPQHYSAFTEVEKKAIAASVAATPLRVSLSRARDAEKRVVAVDRYGSKSHGAGLDEGDEAAAWFTAVMGKKCRFVRSSGDASKQRCPIDQKLHEGATTLPAPDRVRIHFVCYGHLHLVSQPSLDALAAALEQKGSTKGMKNINAERFRANLLIGSAFDGSSSKTDGQSSSAAALYPWIEEEWASCEIRPHDNSTNSWSLRSSSATKLRFAKHTDRCNVPMHDPSTGERRKDCEPVVTIGKVHGAKFPEAVARYHLQQLRRQQADRIKKEQGNGTEEEEEEEKPKSKSMFGVEFFCERKKSDQEDNFVVLRVGDWMVPTALQPPLEIEPVGED